MKGRTMVRCWCMRSTLLWWRKIRRSGIAEPVDWMLLTSEEVKSIEQAEGIIGYYQCRWVIEEWQIGRLRKGCRLELAHMVESIETLRRMTAVLSIVAVRLLELRDLAYSGAAGERPGRTWVKVPDTWIIMVAALGEDRAGETDPQKVLADNRQARRMAGKERRWAAGMEGNLERLANCRAVHRWGRTDGQSSAKRNHLLPDAGKGEGRSRLGFRTRHLAHGGRWQ